MQEKSLKISWITLAAFIIVGWCYLATSCGLNKSVSVTTGRYDNIPSRNFQPNIEIETARDTGASFRF